MKPRSEDARIIHADERMCVEEAGRWMRATLDRSYVNICCNWISFLQEVRRVVHDPYPEAGNREWFGDKLSQREMFKGPNIQL